VADSDGAKILPGPGVRKPSLRDEEILIDRARGVPAAELAKKHGITVQRIYNLTNENRARFRSVSTAGRSIWRRTARFVDAQIRILRAVSQEVMVGDVSAVVEWLRTGTIDGTFSETSHQQARTAVLNATGAVSGICSFPGPFRRF
jgi:phage host-nuclease inhibitor protein Gam